MDDKTSDEGLAVENMVKTVVATIPALYRDFPWRRTEDPYAVMVSEVMLQQTQVVRVLRYFERWMSLFPTVDALASASRSDVLEAWQGLGYNRRCLALYACAQEVSVQHDGELPRTYDALIALPGIGPATAAGVLAFAFDEPASYLETNVRTVVLHEIWPEREGVSDREVMAVVDAAAAYVAAHGAELGALIGRPTLDARAWNYALLDYGFNLKKLFPNPSRRSKTHTRQSTYEGSRRQKRAALLRALLAEPGLTARELRDSCASQGLVMEAEVAEDVLRSLVKEDFAREEQGRYWV